MVKIFDETGRLIAEKYFSVAAETLDSYLDEDEELGEVHTYTVEWEDDDGAVQRYIVEDRDDVNLLSDDLPEDHEPYYYDDDDDVYEPSEAEYKAMEDALINRTDKNY